MVIWLHQNRSDRLLCPAQQTEGCTAMAINMAASNGHLDVVIWLDDNRTDRLLCPAQQTDHFMYIYKYIRYEISK